MPDNLTDEARRIVEDEVQIERWDGEVGYCRHCPGEHLHTTASTGSPIVYVDGKFPVLTCFHHSCAPVIAETNQRLYDEWVDFCDGHGIKIELTPEEKAERAFRKHLRVLRTNARLRLAPKIIGAGVAVDGWTKESPFNLNKYRVQDHWLCYLAGLYAPGDVLWIGELYQSGREYKYCFRTTAQWITEMDVSPGPQICAAPFKERNVFVFDAEAKPLYDSVLCQEIPEGNDAGGYDLRGVRDYWRTGDGKGFVGVYRVEGQYRRAKKFIGGQPYIVVESDTLDKVRFGSIVRYFQKYAMLRALTDTGNKSIHAVFDRPDLPLAKLRELYAIAEGLGADPKLFRACATTRLPGCERLDDQFNVLGWQRLLYLNPKFTYAGRN
ncbi:MAG TPA: hypothetical protein VGR14_21110 [Verrucomicrobiae bacterium]|jgi:hypothetical protein|nr:hypothetical protein [Verrucomicrobiae bacterium]